MSRFQPIKGLIFDKDGTLFDFNATWGHWTRGMIEAESSGDPELRDRLADVLDFDMDNNLFRPASLVIASTAGDTADAILSVVGGKKAALLDRMDEAAKDVPQVEATPLRPFFKGLLDDGYVLGLVTNDSEAPARSHLQRANVEDLFAFIVGYDSGFGGKPEPGQLFGFCEACTLDPTECVMIGDSLHDLHAGRAAGMRTVGVLTGPAPREELAPVADTVLTSIAELPQWLGSLT